ncbi:hypothetical protein ACROYT_G013676 [Oculina patagonica]
MRQDRDDTSKASRMAGKRKKWWREAGIANPMLDPVAPETVRKRKILKRQREPTQISDTNSEVLSVPKTEISSRHRKKETLESCKDVHGGTSDNKKPALDGMWVTLVNKASPKQLIDYVANSSKVVNKVLGSVVKSSVESFEISNDNSLLLTSKRRKAIQLLKGAQIPKLLTYDKAKQYIESNWNVAKVHDLSELYHDLDESEHVNGERELTDLLHELADLFIFIDESLGENSHLIHFGEERYHFHVACGADGAPFGKDDEATAWLLSFINSGTHITSEKENFLLAGANCSENHIVMKRFAKKLVHEFQSIKVKTFHVRSCSVKFSLELFPSDMTFLASYSGELSNAAFFFSSFGNVNETKKHITNGSLGPEPENTWHPWVYAKRLEVVEGVKQLKEKLDQSSYAESTKRTKVLDFIRGKESRQEFEPLIGPYVDLGLAEPLHNANNAWQFIHSTILSLSLEKSNIPSSCKDVNDVPENSSFAKYLSVLKTEVKAGRLLKKVTKWFNSGRKNSFDYRFTGKESKKLSHKFMYLVSALENDDDPPETKMRLCAIANCALELRGAVSLFSRVNIDGEDLMQGTKLRLM